MIWSKYNFVFRSEKYGGLLYNAMTNSFLSVPEAFYGKLASLHEGDELECNDFGLLLQLIAAKALVDPGEDARLRDVLRMKIRSSLLSDGFLKFIVAPTLACNCACPYCFEKDHPAINMSEETEDAFIRFLERFHRDSHLRIFWFGGEPLLRFDQIKRMTEKIRKLSFREYTASLVTNGTLMNAEVVSHLNELAINSIKISIDGPKEIHDSRRKLATGGGTFDTILQNVDGLLESDWKGDLSLRVNVDADNRKYYPEIYQFLTDRYQKYGEKVRVYSGITTFDGVCGMDPDTVAKFALEEFKDNYAHTRFDYPHQMNYGCIAVSKSHFAVGPQGELYKCVEHIGKKEFQVGSIFPGEPWNLELLARFLEGENILNDPVCMDCKCFPICDGGCTKERIMGGNACAYSRNYLPQLLEAHYDLRQKKKKQP